jgi:hypothetical protein
MDPVALYNSLWQRRAPMTRKKPELTVVDGDKGADNNMNRADGDSNNEEGAQVQSTKKPSQKIGDFVVPYGYEIWSDGLYVVTSATIEDPAEPSLKDAPSSVRRMNLRRICHEPIWIRRFGRVLDSDEQLLELAYKDPLTGTIIATWVDRLQVASKQAIVSLARNGVPVVEGNSIPLMHFLDAALHLNGGKLEVHQIVQRTGAHEIKEGTGWLIGDRWIGPLNTRVVPDPRNRADFSSGFTVSGDEDQWFATFKRVAAIGPVARWLLYSTFAAPLLRFVDERTFVIHHWGRSGSGKTALAKFATSAWGDPHLLTMTFNRTKLSFTETFQYLDDVPVLFDELQMSNRDDILMAIYALVSEQHRMRAGQSGGLQARGGGWHTVVRTTGEEEITGRDGKTADLGGAANRTIQIGVPVLEPEQALEIHKWLAKRHYGWGAMRFLGQLAIIAGLPDGQGKSLLTERFVQIRDEIVVRSAATPTLHARVGQLAVVALAEYLANRWFFGIDPDAALEGAITDAVTVAVALSSGENRVQIAEQALQLIHDHFIGHRHLWFDLTNDAEEKTIAEGRQKQLFGVVTPTEIWLVQREANNLLSKHGFPPRRVWADLLNANQLLLPPSTKGAYGSPRRHGSFYAKVYVLDRTGIF